MEIQNFDTGRIRPVIVAIIWFGCFLMIPLSLPRAQGHDVVLGPAGYCLAEVPLMSKPKYLHQTAGMPSTVTRKIGERDRVSGNLIQRITGNVGALIDAPFVPAPGSNVEAGNGTPTWSNTARQGYVLHSPWNVDHSLIKLGVFTDDEPAVRYDVFLDGRTYAPVLVTQLSAGGGFRWSEDPARANEFYRFPAARRLRDGRPDTGFSPDTTIKVYAIDTDTPELNLTREIALPNRFDLHALGGKVQVAWTGEREVVALGGGVARAGGGYDWYAYLFDLEAETMVGDPFLLTDPDCGLDDAAVCGRPYWNQMRYAPDGRHLLVAYDGGSYRPQRLLDVDPVTGTITPHELPQGTCGVCLPGARSQGFIRASWGHAAFAAGEALGQTYLVGTTQWTRKQIGFVDASLDSRDRVGRVVAFDLQTNTYRSLSDPDAEAMYSHVSAANRALPGWVFVTYGSDPGGKFSEEIVAINIENPRRIKRITHTRSNPDGCYRCQPQATPSRDGRRVIFASSWGTDQQTVGAYATTTTVVDPEPTWTDVCTREELEAINEDPSGHYRLVCDIDLSGRDWTPLPPFTGVLDGNGKTIRNMTVPHTGLRAFDHRAGHSRGFISQSSGTIRNLTLVDAHVSGSKYVGVLVGNAAYGDDGGYGTIDNCHVSGRIESTGVVYGTDNHHAEFIGGLLGRAYRMTVRDSSAEVQIRSTAERNGKIGGLIGSGWWSTIENSRARGRVTTENATGRVGGLVGSVWESTIADSHASMHISARARIDHRIGNIGGLVGVVRGSWDRVDGEWQWGQVGLRSTIRRSSAQVNIEIGLDPAPARSERRPASSGVGGFVGNVPGQITQPIQDCYATGTLNVDLPYIRGVGGFAGLLGRRSWGPPLPTEEGPRIQNSYTTVRLSLQTDQVVQASPFVGLQHRGRPPYGEYPSDDYTEQSFWNADTWSYWHLMGTDEAWRWALDNDPENQIRYRSGRGMRPGGGTGKTNVELHDRDTYVGWDFETVWMMPKDGGYPVLKSHVAPAEPVATVDCVANPPARIDINRRPYHDFGRHVVGKRRSALFTVSNQQDGVARRVRIAPMSQAFTLVPGGRNACPIDPDTGTFELQPEARCRVRVAFRARRPGSFEDALRIDYLSAGTIERSISRRLMGEAYSGAYIVASRGPVADYGTRLVGSPRNTMVTLTNLGDQPAVEMAGTVRTTLGWSQAFQFRGGSYPGDRARSTYGVEACGDLLPARPDDDASKVNKCRVAVVYSPTVAEESTGELVVQYRDSERRRRVTRNLRGQGNSGANLTISRGRTYDFGDVEVGHYVTTLFTVTNRGDQTAEVIDVSVNGDDGAAFAVVELSDEEAADVQHPPCGATLTGREPDGSAANNRCVLAVRFMPDQAGDFVGRIDLRYAGQRRTRRVHRGVIGTGRP